MQLSALGGTGLTTALTSSANGASQSFGTPTFSRCLLPQKDSPGSLSSVRIQWLLLSLHWSPGHHRLLPSTVLAFLVAKMVPKKLKKQTKGKKSFQENRNELFDEIHEKP